jgi:hypothetical protein
MRRSPVLWLLIFFAGLLLLSLIAPAEKTLGTSARVVYLHGVWVWAALSSFGFAGAVGLVGLLARKESLHRWSRAWGRTGLIFWITYLPISMWAMQTNWNGLFLAEPRWRLAIVFAIGGLALQIGLVFLEKPIWASVVNLLYFAILLVALQMTENVMHPPSPILDSNALRIQLYFFSMLILAFLMAWQVARIWHRLEQPGQLAVQTG